MLSDTSSFTTSFVCKDDYKISHTTNKCHEAVGKKIDAVTFLVEIQLRLLGSAISVINSVVI